MVNNNNFGKNPGFGKKKLEFWSKIQPKVAKNGKKEKMGKCRKIQNQNWKLAKITKITQNKNKWHKIKNYKYTKMVKIKTKNVENLRKLTNS